MIAAGQQFAAAVTGRGIVHLAFWSLAEDGWRLACLDAPAVLIEEDPILSCTTCIEVADEEVVGQPALLEEGDDVEAYLAEMEITVEELAGIAGVSPASCQAPSTSLPAGRARALSRV